MSKFFGYADAMAASLEALPILKGARIVVDRQHDIVSEIRKVIGKAVGNLILVSWAGGPNGDDEADTPQIESGYNVTVFSKPVIRKGETSADEIAEAIALHLHDWRQNPNLGYSGRLVCTGIYPQDLPEILAHQIQFKTINRL